MSSRAFILIDPSSYSSSIGDLSIESKIDSSSTKLRSFSTQSPSSKCEKFIISPVCSWDYVAYRIYETDGHVAGAPEYRRDMYVNAICTFFCQIKRDVKKLFTYIMYVYDVPFFMLWNSNKDTPKTNSELWLTFNAFVLMWETDFCTKHGQKTRRFYAEGFVTVDSLCGAVGSPSWFTKCLIGRTGNILSVMHINANCIYLSETQARP